MINDKIFFDEKDPTGINYDTPFTVYGSFNGRLWSKTPEGTVKFYVQGEDIVNDLTTGGTTVPASAETVKELKTQLDAKGKVLQVVQGSTSTEVFISATSYADTGLSTSITPRKQNSKILVFVNQQWGNIQQTNAVRLFALNLVRDSTQIAEKEYRSYGAVGSNGFFHTSLDGTFLKEDSPSIPETPVPITYKTQSKVDNGANNTSSRFQQSSSPSTMTLMEIEPNT